MKKSMIAVLAGLVSAATFAASYNDVMISFTKPAEAKYKDGSNALPGECYAVVWMPVVDGHPEFAGINADGTGAGDGKVVMIACLDDVDNVVFRLPGDYVVPGDTVTVGELYAMSGAWGVYLLDTRRYPVDGNGVIQTDGTPEVGFGKTKIVNGAGDAGEASGYIVSVSAGESLVAGDSAKTPANASGLAIQAIKLDGDVVKITVSGSLSCLQYMLQSGNEPNNLLPPSDGAAQYGNTDGVMTILTPKTPGAKFFQVKSK